MHSPVLVPGVCKSSDEDELDEDKGKSSHYTNVMPGWETKKKNIELIYISENWAAMGCKSQKKSDIRVVSGARLMLQFFKKTEKRFMVQ